MSLSEKKNSKNIIRIIMALAAAVVFFLILSSHRNYTDFEYIPEFSFNDATGECDTRYYKLGLPEGDYGIALEYEASEDVTLSMHFGSTDAVPTAALKKGKGSLEYTVRVDSYDDNISFSHNGPESGVLRFTSLHVNSDRPIYNDRIFEAFIFLACALWLIFFFSSGVFLEAGRWEKLLFILIHVAVAVSSLPLLSDTLFWGADAPAHVMRIEGVKDAMENGQFPAFVFPYHNNGYGMLGFMYPNLFLYIPAFLRMLDISIPAVSNAVYFFFNISAAVCAYITGRVFYGKTGTRAELFTILYLLFPYRMVDIYTRADLPETISMCFIPLVLAGLWITICRDRGDEIKAAALLSVGMTGVFNSHIPSSVLILGTAILFALIFIRRIANRRGLIIIVSSVIYTFCLNMHFIIPFIKLYMSGLNTGYYRENTGIRMAGRFGFLQLFGIHDFSNGTAWGGLSLIGGCCLLVIIAGIILNRKETSVTKRFMTCSGILAALLFLTVPSEFPWDRLQQYSFFFPYTSVMEYSFRIMLMVSPLLLISAVWFLGNIRPGGISTHVISGILILLSFVCILPGTLNERKSEAFMSVISGGGRDNELREYWPAGATEGVFNDDMVFWSSENLTFDNYEKDGLRVDFDYTASGEDMEWIAPPVLYYPGYCAEAVTPSGEKYRLGVSQGDYFRARIDLPALLSGSHVSFYYGGIWYFRIAYAVSALSALCGCAFIIIKALRGRRRVSRL